MDNNIQQTKTFLQSENGKTQLIQAIQTALQASDFNKDKSSIILKQDSSTISVCQGNNICNHPDSKVLCTFNPYNSLDYFQTAEEFYNSADYEQMAYSIINNLDKEIEIL